MSTELVEGLDNVFLLMDTPSHQMTVSSTLIFEKEISKEKVVKQMLQFCEDFPRYRAIPVSRGPLKTPIWEYPENFKVEDHIKFHQLKHVETEAESKKELMHFTSKVLSLEWDLTKPLWGVHLVYGLYGGGSAMILRGHHVIADGQGFVRSLLMCTSARDSLQAAVHKPTVLETKPTPIHFLPAKDASPMEYLQFYLKRFQMFLLAFLLSCMMFFKTLYAMLRTIIKFTFSRRTALLYDGPQTAQKVVAWSSDITLADIALVRKAFTTPSNKVTLNDVVCTALTKGFHTVLSSIDQLTDKELVMMIPVSLRAQSDWGLHNAASGIVAYFPLDPLPSTGSLLVRVGDEIRTLKNSILPKTTGVMTTLAGLFPGLYIKRTHARLGGIGQYFHSQPHCVATNVPGPSIPIYMEGERIVRYSAVPPQTGKAGLGIGFLSYDGRLSMSVLSDYDERWENIADRIAEAFVASFQEMVVEAKEILQLEEKSSTA